MFNTGESVMTQVVHISEAHDVYIGRAGKGADGYFGNPHPIVKPCSKCGGTIHDRLGCIAAFQTDFDQRIVADAAYRERVLSLKDKRLGCFCRRPGTTTPCHGDVLVRWLEHQPTPEQATAESKTDVPEIREFRGEYAWASNFFAHPMEWSGFRVPTLEHAYQLDKCPTEAVGVFPGPDNQMITMPWRQAIAQAPTPGAAKKLGKVAPLRPDWETRKVKLMAGLLTRKFADPALRQKLLATGDAKLVEGNWWGDRFWGIDLKTGEGQYTLGRLLMTLRIRLREKPPLSPTAPTVTRPLVKIISGGQTGADQAGLQVAEAFGIPTGGWAPKGWITSRGPNPNLLRDRFKLQEHPGGYPARTFANAKESDGTIRLAYDFTTAGERCTLNGIREAGRPHFDVDLAHPRPAEEAVAWIREYGIRILNVAGNRERPKTPGTFRAACFWLRDLLVSLGYERVPRTE